MKQKLMEMFQRDYKRYYEVELFRKLGFVRKQCSKCLKFFWTLDQQKEVCGDSECVGYGFIGRNVTKDKLTYGECWNEIERFFRKNGHQSLPRYPVVCRWFPGLYFTIAGIVDFQRMTDSTTVFEMRHNPCILAQPCLRFNDIPNVGVTGRHYTNFAMIQQTSIFDGKNGYWKDRCIDLDFELLTKVFGIRDKEITFLEDVWAGPNAFGPSLEFFAHGLELGNAVFTQFLGNAENYTEMGQKVIDMGAGLERFAWIANGTVTSYDAVFGGAVEYMKKRAGMGNSDVFERYASVSGRLDIEHGHDLLKAKEAIAQETGISAKELKEIIEPMQAIYAIADHTKTLLLAIADGAMPSNVSGGYNLRVILRRALSFIDEFGFGFDLESVAEKHAKQLKGMYPELEENLEGFNAVIRIETDRHRKSVEKARSIIRKELEKGSVATEKLIGFYTSHGIAPEMIEKQSKIEGKQFSIPSDFYARLTETHMKEQAKEEVSYDDRIAMLPKTGLMFYEFQNEKAFSAKVLAAFENAVVLDRTLFYPEGGGQVADTGVIDSVKVTDVQKRHGVILHFIEKQVFSEGQQIRGEIDFERRKQLMQHHTAVHVVNGACRHVIGKHIWQAGTKKTAEKAWLDVTHYLPFSDEEIEKMERVANSTVRSNMDVKEHVMPRMEAERQFGLRIYQGGAIPSETLRIIEIPEYDVEACGGTHVSSTGDIGKIVVVSSERIADGVNRLTIKAGMQADAFLRACLKESLEIENMLKCSEVVSVSDSLSKVLANDMAVYRELQRGGRVFDVSYAKVKETIERFLKEIGHLRMSMAERMKAAGNEAPFKAESLEDACKHIFSTWKRLSKEKEASSAMAAERLAEDLSKKISGNRIVDIIAATREEMLGAAELLVEKNGQLTVILANQRGELVCMSTHEDAGSIAKDICSKAGGNGGGNRKLGSGRVEISKLIKIMKDLWG